MTALDIITIILLSLGIIVFLGAVVGFIRFPDPYTRIHAAGKGDTLSSLLILLGLAIYNLHDFSKGNLITSMKIMLILIFVFVTAPTTTHAIMDAAYRYGLKPWVKDKKEDAP